MNAQQFLTRCDCGNTTSKAYARTHGGKCKACVTGQPPTETTETAESRNARIIDSGWQAYAREEGHYDQGDY